MQKIAKAISVLGHPFLTIPLYTLIISFSVYTFQKALFISFLIVGCFFIPVSLWNYLRTKKGRYTNFDVSVQKQRNSMYLFAIPVFGAVLLVFWISGQTGPVFICLLFAFLLLILSFVTNFLIKCSGHVSMTIFLALMILPLNKLAGILLIVFTFVVGWSRVELKRHTLAEVITGLVIGLLCGAGMLCFQGYFAI